MKTDKTTDGRDVVTLPGQMGFVTITDAPELNGVLVDTFYESADGTRVDRAASILIGSGELVALVAFMLPPKAHELFAAAGFELGNVR